MGVALHLQGIFFCLLESIINVNLQYEVQGERLVYINEDINYD